MDAEPAEVREIAPAAEEETTSEAREPVLCEGDGQPEVPFPATGKVEEEPVGFTLDQDPSDDGVLGQKGRVRR